MRQQDTAISSLMKTALLTSVGLLEFRLMWGVGHVERLVGSLNVARLLSVRYLEEVAGL